MADEPQGQELAVREPADAGVPLPPMNDAEMASLYRTAKALAESRLFKDAMQAGQAFAKILAGRDLGLTPFEAMSGLHVIEGKIEAGADLHATRVRAREGYDFRVAWIKAAGEGNDPAGGAREAVYASDDKATDLRVVVGCAIEFTVDGETRGVSTWTADDSVRAGLMREKSNHQKFPRNMYFARAMTNGVAWYVPEVMGGMRVYGVGEIPRDPDLTDVAGVIADADVVLPTAVEAIVARARTLGYAPLANRSAVAMAVDGQPEDFVMRWAQNAARDLNRYASGKAPTEPEPAPEPAPVGEESAPPAIDATIAEDDQTGRVEALRARALDLLAEADGLDIASDPRAGEVREEAERIMVEVDAMTTGEQEQMNL